MTSDDAAIVREMLATMAAEKPHWQCPDDWKDCNEAREDVPRLVAALERAVLALEEIDYDTCGRTFVDETLAGIRADLEGRAT